MNDVDAEAAQQQNTKLVLDALTASIATHRRAISDIDVMAKRGVMAADQAIANRICHLAQLEGLERYLERHPELRR